MPVWGDRKPKVTDLGGQCERCDWAVGSGNARMGQLTWCNEATAHQAPGLSVPTLRYAHKTPESKVTDHHLQ